MGTCQHKTWSQLQTGMKSKKITFCKEKKIEIEKLNSRIADPNTIETGL